VEARSKSRNDLGLGLGSMYMTLGEHIVDTGQGYGKGYGHAYAVWNEKHPAWLIHRMLSMSSQTRNCISLTAMRRRCQLNLVLSYCQGYCTKSSCKAAFGSQPRSQRLYHFTIANPFSSMFLFSRSVWAIRHGRDERDGLEKCVYSTHGICKCPVCDDT
jgi:hypothetical protein